MNPGDLLKEILDVYQKHGWQLRRLLLRAETRATLDAPALDSVEVRDAAIDAMWFARGSGGGREAWELRLLAENPYALFETFEEGETEEQRNEMLNEMEARLREYVNK